MSIHSVPPWQQQLLLLLPRPLEYVDLSLLLPPLSHTSSPQRTLLHPIKAKTLEESPEKHAEAWSSLKSVDGVVLPGGFGIRGVDGKILTAK